MPEEILINATQREVRVALLENGTLQEIYIERSSHQGILGNIYKGKVKRLLPGIQAAFIDIGLERDAFIHAHDIQANADLRDLLHPGQEILVQVYKNPLGSKGPRLTTQFTIPSRYLVLTPGVPHILVSQKISDENERIRLANMLTEGPQDGYIFRTAAAGATLNEIVADKQFLDRLWQDVLARAKAVQMGTVVYEDIPIILRVLRDLAGYDVERVRIDQKEWAEKMREFARLYVPHLIDRIEYYGGERPILDIYSVEDELQKALERKVYLKSGGHVVFDQTEAMTTIDVNTGSYVGHSNIEETIFKTNIEAVEVIARQVRLRNLGGMIIIDFIDMIAPTHKTFLLESLAKALAKDTAKIEMSELTRLGLVQMTRKRSRESLEHILCVPCPLCAKRGSIKSLETMCYEIVRELKRIGNHYPWSGFLIVASERVANYILEEGPVVLSELELQLGRPIKCQAESSYTQEQYDILPMAEKE